MLRFLSRLFLISTVFLALTISFSGCGEGGGSAVSPLPAGTGYKIVLSATPKEITSGGSVSLVGAIFDPQGNAVSSEEDAFLFSSDAADSTFTPKATVDVKSGTAQASMQWEDKSDNDTPMAPKLCTITGSYRGAIASVQITLISKSF